MSYYNTCWRVSTIPLLTGIVVAILTSIVILFDKKVSYWQRYIASTNICFSNNEIVTITRVGTVQQQYVDKNKKCHFNSKVSYWQRIIASTITCPLTMRQVTTTCIGVVWTWMPNCHIDKVYVVSTHTCLCNNGMSYYNRYLCCFNQFTLQNWSACSMTKDSVFRIQTLKYMQTDRTRIVVGHKHDKRTTFFLRVHETFAE